MNRGKVTNRPIVLASVMVAMFIGAVEATIVSTAMPSIAADLGGFSRYSWIFSAYLLMSTVTVLIYGKLADLFGRKLIFMIGITIFLVGSILCGLAETMEQLILFRFIQGLGAGAVMPIATTIVGDIYTTVERAKVQGYLSSVWGISAVSGPVLGGLIVEYVDWQYVFWMNVPLGLVAMLGIYFFLHEPLFEKKTKIHVKNAVYLTVALSTLLFWLVEGGNSFSRISLISFLILLCGFIFIVLYLFAEKNVQHPILPIDLWKNKTILYANIVTFTTGVMMIGVSSYLPTFVTGVMEQKAMIAGFTLTAMSIGWPIASSIAGHLLIRMGPFRVSFIGGLSLIGGSILFVLMKASSGPIWAALSSFFIGIGMGLTSTAFIVTIQAVVQHEQRGAATALNMFMRSFGSTVGVALFGAVLNSSLLHIFSSKKTNYTVDDINLLLTAESRQSLSILMRESLQKALDVSLQWVYLTVLLFAFISVFYILKIPRGKAIIHDNNRT